MQPYRSIYHTRRSEPARPMLSIPRYKYKQHIKATNPLHIYPIVFFFYLAPQLWNSLPETCRCAFLLGSFRAHLKTYL